MLLNNVDLIFYSFISNKKKKIIINYIKNIILVIKLTLFDNNFLYKFSKMYRVKIWARASTI